MSYKQAVGKYEPKLAGLSEQTILDIKRDIYSLETPKIHFYPLIFLHLFQKSKLKQVQTSPPKLSYFFVGLFFK